MTKPLILRLSNKFTISDGCWEWTAALGRGYGIVMCDDKVCRVAHRVIYELLVGPIPEGAQLDHLCRNTVCVKPSHLEPVTPKVNINRGRRANAEKTHCRHGHEYTEENIIWHQRKERKPSRECRICTEARNVGPKPLPTHCKKGHEYTPENVYLTKDNARACRICRQQWMRDFYARKKITS